MNKDFFVKEIWLKLITPLSYVELKTNKSKKYRGYFGRLFH